MSDIVVVVEVQTTSSWITSARGDISDISVNVKDTNSFQIG